MLSSTVENYLKALFLLNPEGKKQVTTGELAKSLDSNSGVCNFNDKGTRAGRTS